MAAVTVDGFEVPAEVLAKKPHEIHAYVDEKKREAGWVPPQPKNEEPAEETAAAEATPVADTASMELPVPEDAESSSTRRAKSPKRASTEG